MINSNGEKNNIGIVKTSKTGDLRTDDFDLTKEKIPALSTIRTQIRNAKKLIETGYTIPVRTEFDRLKIGINLNKYAEDIQFVDLRLENCPNPTNVPTLTEEKARRKEILEKALEKSDEAQKEENDYYLKDEDLFEMFSDDFDNQHDNENLDINLDTDIEPELEAETENEQETSVINYSHVKKRIGYEEYKNTIGLINLFINNGYLVIDITGKWMFSEGVLGSINKDNIKEALHKILDLYVVRFDIDKFIEHAQVFICDVCVDLELESVQQVYRYIDGLSSFFPLSSNKFKISKYGRHGLMFVPIADNSGYSLVVYSKGQELDYSVTRNTKAKRYTVILGYDGQELAKRILRLETKLYKLDDIRECLDIPKTRYIVSLNDVLNSTVPVMLNMFEKFSGNAQVLLERLKWLSDVITSESDKMKLTEIFIAERFVEILKDCCFNIEIAKAHIKTEYFDAGDKELEKFNTLANRKEQVLNFLIYRKPKSVTIMLSVLNMLYSYYSTGMGGSHD